MLFQAEAIRRILGQDSNRKKREEKKKKRVEELAQVLDTKCIIIIPSIFRSYDQDKESAAKESLG